MPDPHSDAAHKVGRRIAELRRRATLSARSLAECADLDITHVQRLEKGVGNPTLLTLTQIAVALEVDLGELVTGVDADDLPEGRSPYGYSERSRHRREPRSWA